MNNDNNINVSVIIPVYTGHQNLKNLLQSINKQTLLPSEIAIVDSCSHTEVKELIDNMHLEIPIHYHRENKRAFPGKARNIGVSIAKCEYIAFLDCRTIPSDNWLSHYSKVIKENEVSMVVGSTKTLANGRFQWYLRAASYGTESRDTLPGTLMEKQLFESVGRFEEYLRMGEDLEWLNRLQRKKNEYTSVETPFIEYDGLPESLFVACRKYLKSGYYGSFVMENFKNLIGSTFLIAVILIIPRWNFMMKGWDASPLFIPHVTKIVFLIVTFLLLIWRLIYFLTPRKLPDNIFVLTAKFSILAMITLAVYNWNRSVVLWLENAAFLIPHITQIYIGILLGLGFIYRGLVKPIMSRTPPKELLPYQWLIVGTVGLTMDLVKIPGTIVGSIVGRVQQLLLFRDNPAGK